MIVTFSDTRQIILNVFGGVIVAVLILIFEKARKQLSRRSFRKIFGDDIENAFFVIYPNFQSPSRDTKYEKLPSIVKRNRVSSATNLTTVHGTAVTRAVSHLTYMIGNNSKVPPRIMSDHEMDSQMDISFMSIGGLTNFKTVDLLENEVYDFLDFNSESIISKKNGQPIVTAGSGFDYGIITKIKPFNDSKRIWLCCAGIGEWGTSGAAWWLSRNWKKIYKKAKKKPFACVTSTKQGSDDSTQLRYLFLSSQEIEEVARNFNTSS